MSSDEVNNQLPEIEDHWFDSSETEAVNPEPLELEAEFLPVLREPETEEISKLQRHKQTLEAEIAALETRKAELIAQEVGDIQATIEQMLKTGLKDLETRRQALEINIEQLERRKERIKEEMRTTFAGASQELAIRVQGFKDYLVGSLQDLASAAEQLELGSWESRPAPTPIVPPAPVYREREVPVYRERGREQNTSAPKTRGFESQSRHIRELLDQYRTRPDYYGPPWQLRRTFEPIHAERVQSWFFNQGGRGTIRSLGSRLQNILVAAAVIAVLNNLQGDRLRVLILANSPERLGEWRRGLQDCLGISRSDFAPERGISLFESPETLIQKAERLLDEQQTPLIIIDDTEDRINMNLLQFPLWLAFASDPQSSSSYYF
jgi:hypothetical protein